jgi:hypothetical protein
LRLRSRHSDLPDRTVFDFAFLGYYGLEVRCKRWSQDASGQLQGQRLCGRHVGRRSPEAIQALEGVSKTGNLTVKVDGTVPGGSIAVNRLDLT